MKHRTPLRLALIATLMLPGFAFAHPGHGPESGFALGFVHPFGGADHILLLVAAGVLAHRIGTRASVSLLAGLLTLLVAGHRDWIMPGAEGWSFVAGFLSASLALVAVGVAAAGVYRRAARARAQRSTRTTPAIRQSR